MNTQVTNNPIPFPRRLIFQLWALMMALVLLAISFMWIAQVFLFNQNYIQAAANDVKNKVAALQPQLETTDLLHNPEWLFRLSMSTNGKMLIIDSHQELVAAYSMGHPIDMAHDENLYTTWCTIQASDYYQAVTARQPFSCLEEAAGATWLKIGLPIDYGGEKSYAILHHSLSDNYALLKVNQRQLIILSILLTVVASLLAALFSRKFSAPILSIKRTIDAFAQNDLTAAPGVERQDELGQLAQSVTALGTELRRVDVLRKEVIANVSHELRSPLALIGGYAEMVRDITWQDEQKRQEDLNLIIAETKRMSEMVNDILDYSQLQAGYLPLKKDSYNLYDIIESEVDNCQKTAQAHAIPLSLCSDNTDITVQVDALKMSQVIRNLLYNAINHTGDGGHITIEITTRPDAVHVAVANPGEEIPPEERALIWERYHRSQHQGGRKQGTGIGLSIVSTILKAHDMPYGVHCQDGLTIFWFDYPLK